MNRTDPKEIFRAQYRLVREARQVVFELCATLSGEDYGKGVEVFGGRSIRELQVHVANVYEFWLDTFALKAPLALTRAEACPALAEVRATFADVDELVRRFCDRHAEGWQESITATVPWRGEEVQATPLALLTHAITHESHHKGQILTMARLLGYPPPDADIIRFNK